MTPVRVGALFIAALAALTLLYVRINKNQYSSRSTYRVVASFTDAAGLADKTRVQVAGIDVGRIESIELRGNRAYVQLRIQKSVALYADAAVMKMSESLLGDYKLDIVPGNPLLARLGEGAEIQNVVSKGDMTTIQSELKVVIANVREITDTMKRVIASEHGEQSLQVILKNVEQTTIAINSMAHNLNRLVAANDQNVSGILNNVNHLSVKLNDIADSVNRMIGKNEGDVKQSVSSIRDAIDKANQSLEHISSITQKIDKGDGTIGKLLNDGALHERINDTVSDVSGLVKKISSLQTEVDLRTEYQYPLHPDELLVSKNGYFINTLSLRLKPRPDSYYMFDLVSDPRGRPTRTLTTLNRSPGDQLDSPTKIEERINIDFNSLNFSMQIAKRYKFVTFRFGLIENTGGLGLNFHAWKDRFEFRTDVFRFSGRDRFGNTLYPRVKTWISLSPVKHIYLHAGVDDPINLGQLAFTGGIGIRFTDDDLKLLLGSLGSLVGR